jgi:DNA-binding XRE family transcriptional regulator
MAKSKKKRREETTDDLLKKILITQLAIARVSQDEIGRIVGISKGSVNAIARHVKLPKLGK